MSGMSEKPEGPAVERPGSWWAITLALVLATMAGCEAAPSAEPTEAAATASTEPAWLIVWPNYRREESGRLSSEAIAACHRRFPLESLRTTLDSVREALEIEPAETRSHPEAARRLDLLLERQGRRRECIDTSPEYIRSQEIVQSAPDEYLLPVYAEPDSAARHLGTVRITTERDAMGPPRLAFGYLADGADTIGATWTTDLEQVGGYGDYRHTVLDRRGDWLLLPADPFPTPVWLNWRGTFHSPPEVTSIFGEVYSMRAIEAEAAGVAGPLSWESPGVVYLRREGARLRFRVEGRDDRPCAELSPDDLAGDAPAPENAGPDARGADADGTFSIDVADVLDGRGHLQLQIKYFGGC